MLASRFVTTVVSIGLILCYGLAVEFVLILHFLFASHAPVWIKASRNKRTKYQKNKTKPQEPRKHEKKKTLVKPMEKEKKNNLFLFFLTNHPTSPLRRSLPRRRFCQGLPWWTATATRRSSSWSPTWRCRARRRTESAESRRCKWLRWLLGAFFFEEQGGKW